MKKGFIIVLICCLYSTCASCSQTTGKIPQGMEDAYLPEGQGVKVEAWVENLEIPWSLVFLPDGRALVSERPGRIRLIEGGKIGEAPYATLDVSHTGEAGLLGLAIARDFEKTHYVYAMHTYREGGKLYNRVIRLKDEGTKGRLDSIIFDRIPGGRLHDGGRIAFGPDGMLYITAGDTFNSSLAQNLKSLAGKILRVTPEGKIPFDNPFKNSPIYSYGNRNPQGIAWRRTSGDLFESEHGPSGEFGHFGHDEINVIVKGGNYGWPAVIGAVHEKSYIDPIVVWDDATPPSGITFYYGQSLSHLNDNLLVATLGSEALIRIILDGRNGVKRIERWFSGKYGRIRDIVEGPDGALYFLTNNRDGRGSPRPGDDKIYRIAPGD